MDEVLISGVVDSTSKMCTHLTTQERRKLNKPSYITDRRRRFGNFRGTRLSAERVKLPPSLVIILGFYPADLVAVPSDPAYKYYSRGYYTWHICALGVDDFAVVTLNIEGGDQRMSLPIGSVFPGNTN